MEEMRRFQLSFTAPQEINYRQIQIIGNFIHSLRTNRQISITDCAETLGIDYQLLDDIERGSVKKIHTAFIINFIKFIQNEAAHE